MRLPLFHGVGVSMCGRFFLYESDLKAPPDAWFCPSCLRMGAPSYVIPRPGPLFEPPSFPLLVPEVP